MNDFETALAGCSAQILDKMSAIDKRFNDLQALENWPKLSEQIYKKNEDLIKHYSELAIHDWNTEDYFNAGYSVGHIEMFYVDEIKNGMLASPEFNVYAPVLFSAGWYYGLTGVDKKDEAMKCANKDIVATTVLYEAMNAYISGSQKQG